jgi:hypothetical protein
MPVYTMPVHTMPVHTMQVHTMQVHTMLVYNGKVGTVIPDISNITRTTWQL